MNKILKINFTGRGVALAMATMLLFCTVVVQPAQAQSVVNQVKCQALTAFASASSMALQLGEAAMNATFQLQINLLMGVWQVQDAAISAIRSVSEQAFTLTFNAFIGAVSFFFPWKAGALYAYRDHMLNAIHVLETKIDAIRASYREDMLALLKAHQKALTDLVTHAVGTITNAVTTAKDHCSDAHVVATLVSVIAQADLTLTVQGLVRDAQDIVKGVQRVGQRDSEFLQADAEFLRTAASETANLIRALF